LRGGAKVQATLTVYQALAAFVQFRPNVLLSDIALPGEDGYSLLRQIRHLDNRFNKPIPIIAVTALANPASRDRELAAGFAHWLLKPIDFEQLIKVIAHVTGRSASAREALYAC